MPACFDENRPARAEAAQRIVEPRRDADQFGRRSAVEVRSPEACCALQAAILAEDDAFADQRRPQQEPGDPQPKPEPDSGRHGAVEDRDRTRCSGEQDRLRERPMHRSFETRNWLLADNLCHQISAPPPNEKKDRKKDEAAKAIDSPNTIWIRRRKPPPASPKASDRPVTMMMITAMIFVTGPSID